MQLFTPTEMATSRLKSAVQENIETALIDLGKRWQNSTNESFNGEFRDECLAMEWFRNRTVAKIVIEGRRTRYNEVYAHFRANTK
ncbi:integrase core domain-containing protein [Pandoraea fibrosis]|uniref:Transposase n=1 Tax=Pandoraea fibrosis TaxID=1891094 RepID=A0A5E4Z1R9_9BURK|nr:integrase core domain-containing protein [Pandoraea fibrosis]VVE54627.1 transposase [Pandoraea fibrosis]